MAFHWPTCCPSKVWHEVKPLVLTTSEAVQNNGVMSTKVTMQTWDVIPLGVCFSSNSSLTASLGKTLSFLGRVPHSHSLITVGDSLERAAVIFKYNTL